MPATVTVDGQNGPGFDIEGLVLSGVTTFTIDVDKGMLSVSRPDITNQVTQISIPVLSAITVTVASNKVATVTIAD